MNTKKWIGVVVAIGMSASLAVAAENGTGYTGEGFGGRGHHGHHRGNRLASKLNLTDAQKAQLKAGRQSFHEQNKAFFQLSHQTMKDFRAAKKAGDTAKLEALKPTLAAQHAQMKQLRLAQEQNLVSILTPEQKAQFDSLKAERAAHRAAHSGWGEKK